MGTASLYWTGGHERDAGREVVKALRLRFTTRSCVGIFRGMARSKSGLERIVAGLTSGAAIYGLFFFQILNPAWALGLGLVFGVLPVITGLRRGATAIADRSHEKRRALEKRIEKDTKRRDSLEKTVLKVARNRSGVVTPALVVLESDLKLEEAETVLTDLSKRGYAELRVKDNGTLDYYFPELVELPPK